MDRIRVATEGPGGEPSDLDTPAGALWLFVTISEANRQLQAHRLDEAEETYAAIVELLEAQPSSTRRQGHLAISCHILGIVAQFRGRLDEAEAGHGKALEIREELGDRPSMAATYHQLGRVAQDRGRLDEAELRPEGLPRWCRVATQPALPRPAARPEPNPAPRPW